MAETATDLLAQVRQWREAGKGVALATALIGDARREPAALGSVPSGLQNETLTFNLQNFRIYCVR